MGGLIKRICPKMNKISTFMYFAYGSNLLAQRIHIQNPTAIRMGIGKLENYKLGFFGFSQRWGGASATIIPEDGKHVWGAVWEINMENLTDLDNQEGVADNIYFPKTVEVELSDGEVVFCRVYQRVTDPVLMQNHDLFPDDKPSLLYRETIIKGAIESGLPEYYVDLLKNIEHNGYRGQAQIGQQLNVL